MLRRVPWNTVWSASVVATKDKYVRCMHAHASMGSLVSVMPDPLGARPLNRPLGQPLAHSHPHLVRWNELSPGVPATEYVLRRAKFFNAMIDGSVAILAARPEKMMTHDIPYPYRQDTDFFYLSGFAEPGGALIFDRTASGCDRLHLFVRDRDPSKELWWGPRAGVDGARAVFGAEVHSISEFEEVLRPLLTGACALYTNSTTDLSMARRVEAIVSALPDTTSLHLRRLAVGPMAHQTRWTKSEVEIALMRQAGCITSDAFLKIMACTSPGQMEQDLAVRMEFECRKQGAERLGYPCIVAGGTNALTLHYLDNNHVLRSGDLVLVDAGCEFHMYASDVTRTWPVNGRFTPEQRALYSVVLEVQKACISMCQANSHMTHTAIESTALRLMHDGLQELGIVSRDDSDMILTRRLYPHSIGHWLGSDIHDCPTVQPSLPLKSGVVLTIEPGVYIPHTISTIPEKFRGIGIRVEDDVLVTDDGPDVLTAKVPKEVEDVEHAVCCG